MSTIRQALTRIDQPLSTALAVAVSVLITTYFKLPYPFFAPITVIVLMEVFAAHVISTGLLRLIGSIFGIIMGIIIVRFCQDSPWIIWPSATIFYLGLFYGIYKNFLPYMCVFAVLLFCLMLITGLHAPQESYFLARYWLQNLVIGWGCAAFFSWHLQFKGTHQKPVASSILPVSWRLVTAFAPIATLMSIHLWLNYPNNGTMIQAIITIVLLQVQRSRETKYSKAWQRLIGLLWAGAIALSLQAFLLLNITSWLYYLFLFISTFILIKTYWQRPKIRYAALQAAITLCLVCVHQDSPKPHFSLALFRFLGIIYAAALSFALSEIILRLYLFKQRYLHKTT